MARKRKLESKSDAQSEPPKLQKMEEKYPQHEAPGDEVEEYGEGEEYEDSEEVESDDDDENQCVENIADGNVNVSNPSGKTSSTSVATSASNRDDDNDEPVQKLLEPFSKERLIDLLHEAASKHSDVADRIRIIANEDPVHRKIFVHGLGWDATAETLINSFKQYGEIEDCKAVCDKATGKSKGYGFVLFRTRNGARKALKEPQKKIGSRMTSSQLASVGPVPTQQTLSVASMPVQIHTASEYTQRKIYVSNVGAELDPQKLVTFFSKYGEIEEGPLGLDKLTGKPKGFCLFVYKTIVSAKKALEEPHKNFEGHILHCQKAIDGPKLGKSLNYQHNLPQSAQFQRNEKIGLVGSVAGPGHLMAPSAPTGTQFNQRATQPLDPVLNQALTAFLANQGSGLGLTNLLGAFGTSGIGMGMNPSSVPGSGSGIQSGYGSQVSGNSVTPGMVGAYGSRGGLQAAYSNHSIGQGNTARSHGAGHMSGGAPYMGH